MQRDPSELGKRRQADGDGLRRGTYARPLFIFPDNGAPDAGKHHTPLGVGYWKNEATGRFFQEESGAVLHILLDGLMGCDMFVRTITYSPLSMFD